MMKIHNIFHNVQANTCSRLIVHRLEERFEYALTVFLTDSDTIVADHNTEMLPIRFHPTGKPHIVLRIFIGICKQVTHHLRNGLPVDNGCKVLIGAIHRKVLTTLLEGWSKTFTYAFYEFMNVLWSEVHHQTLLFYLAEVKQLVH